MKLYYILFESKQNIINLGFPNIIASLLYENFGKNAFIIAKWQKDYKSFQFKDREANTITFPPYWWQIANRRLSFDRSKLDLTDLVEIYDAASISEEKYNEVMTKHEFTIHEPFNQKEILEDIKTEIENFFFRDTFFISTLIEDIKSGKLTDLKPYKDLSFEDAKDKYDKKRIFKNTPSIKEYPNGWRWINIGARCQLIGKQMKNCGSAGVMSMDEDRTIIALFDSQNKPHVMLTYSPNEKRLSGDEGVGGTAVKANYHEYILDLATHLGVKFDYMKSKSNVLMLKGALKGQVKSIELIEKFTITEIYKLTMNDDSVYYTDTYNVISENDIMNLSKEFNSDIKKTIMKAFDYYLTSDYKIKKMNLQDFIHGER